MSGDLRRYGHPHRFAFRRRCGWCGVQLRGWQINLCSGCKDHGTTAPCPQGSRWDAAPDGSGS